MALLPVPLSARPSEPLKTDEIEELAFVLSNAPQAIRTKMVIDKFHLLHGTNQIGHHSDETLRKKFAAAEIAAFYSVEESMSLEMLQLFLEMQRRKLTTPSDEEAIAGALILTRSFDELKSINFSNPLPANFGIPQIETASNYQINLPDVLRIKDNKLIKESVATRAGLVVVISSPLCGFSQEATKAIESDEDLSLFFRERSLWLVPPARQLQLDIINKWNAQHQNPFVLTNKITSWPLVDRWQTPTFYFIDANGQILDRIDGWPKDGSNMALLKKAVINFKKQVDS